MRAGVKILRVDGHLPVKKTTRCDKWLFSACEALPAERALRL